ncbi:MAG: hypothetical protein ACKOZU_01130 [Planctomycetaceae bacterium]
MTAPDRPSRQNLVVPPPGGTMPMAIGVVVCGCIGFATVWAIGFGRPSGRPAEGGPTHEVPVELPPAAARPEADSAVTPASFRGSANASAPSDRPPSRFAVRPREGGAEPGRAPGRLDLPPESEIAPALAAGSPGASPVAVETPLGDPEPLDHAAGFDPSADAAAIAAERFAGDAAPPPDAVAADPAVPPATEEPAPAAAPAQVETTPPREPEVAATVEHGPPSPPPLVETPPSPPTAVAASAPAGTPFAFGPAPASPMPPPAAEPRAPTTPASLPAPPAAAPPPAAQAVPFASAPALVPGGHQGQDAPLQPPVDVAGQGRPGPVQLEGVQSPQLTVEKRGPREVQVGKPARYEILVRNVGAAVAHDVALRDSVPFGAALVTTTPPAVPGHAAPGVPSDELVWNLGELAPGGQARVVVEIMPQAEGEIGSVASVSFRADASARSRATKPALALACTEPKPVLIGRDAGLTITVSNPGSGVATGVVLEGTLPETVSHRSGRELEFDVGQLKPGESKTIELVLGTRGPGVHTARLAARADGGIEVQQAVRLEVTAPALELAVDMPLRRFLQRPATCAISMVNAGTAPARSVELAAQLPPGMKFVRANNAGWHDERTHRVLWNLEELPPGETGTVEVVVMPVELGPQKIMAAARSADGLADQVAHVCDVEGLAALVFEVADSEDPIEVEGVTEYVVRVGNQGTKAATGVRLTATLLGDLEPVAAQGPAGHHVENLVVSFEPLAKLAPAEEAIYRVRAKGRSAGDQRVQVQITSEDHPAPITKEETTRVYLDR